MIAGIDMGFTGAIAIICPDTLGIVNIYDMPILTMGKERYLDGAEIRKILVDNSVRIAYLEKAQTMPADGKASAGKYMKGAGIIEGICIGLQLKHELVHPATWKKAMMKDMPKGKEASILKCKQIYPTWEFGRVKDHGICDAILIARYGILMGGSNDISTRGKAARFGNIGGAK